MASECAALGFDRPGSQTALLAVLAGIDLGRPAASEEVRAAELAVVDAAARRLLARPEELSPTARPNVSLLVAEAHLARNEIDVARRQLERLRLAAPKDPRVFSALGRCLEAAGEHEAALPYWTKLRRGLRQGSRGWVEAMYHLGLCFHTLGRTEDARKVVTYVVTLYPDMAGDDELREGFRALQARVGVPSREEP